MALPKNTLNKLASSDISSNPHVLFSLSQQDFDNAGKIRLNSQIKMKSISDAYYSKKNVDYISRKLTKKIFLDTNKKYIIDKQDDDDIISIMKIVWDENIYKFEDIRLAIPPLDNLVINMAAADILNSIKVQENYMKLLYEPRSILPKPINASKKGEL